MSGAILCPGCGEMTSDGCEAVDENGNGLGYDNHTPCRCEEEQEYTMNDDTFRDWLVEYRDHLRKNSMFPSFFVAETILARYDALKAAAATGSDAGTPEESCAGYPHDETIRSIIEATSERNWQNYLAAFGAAAGRDAAGMTETSRTDDPGCRSR